MTTRKKEREEKAADNAIAEFRVSFDHDWGRLKHEDYFAALFREPLRNAYFLGWLARGEYDKRRAKCRKKK